MSTTLPAVSRRRDKAIERIRAALPHGATPSQQKPPTRTAETIAATVGAAVGSAMEQLTPYGSRGDTFEAVADIEHVDRDGSATRVRLQFSFEGGNHR